MVRDALIELFPPDVPRLVRWRLAISFVCAVFLFHVLWACGFVPGVPGFAYADEVDKKIGKALEPLYAQVGQLAKQQADTDEVVKDIRAEQIATRLRELKTMLCNAANHTDSARLNTDIEVAQRQYKRITGERYPVPECEE